MHISKLIAFISIVFSFSFLFFSNPSYSQDNWYSCTPDQVASYENRIHVKCEKPVGSIYYFAIATDKGEYSRNALSLMVGAKLANRTLRIYYGKEDYSGSEFGCQVGNCRRVKGISLK